MSDLLAARVGMALSLGFHIIFAVLGIGLPLLTVIAEGLYLRTRDEAYLALAKRWARSSAVLFAIGAATGTVLSFQLGLLWPHFMRYAGPVAALPFALEGVAFFTEAICLGIYLYGWDRVSPRAHWLSGIGVACSAAASGFLIVTVNAWMNSPSGFKIVDGRLADVEPLAALFNPGWFHHTLHMLLAAYMAAAGAVAGVHALMLLRLQKAAPGNAEQALRFHRKGLAIALVVAGVFAVLQPGSGDVSARFVARTMPEKLAALEGQFKTERGAPLRIGGLPDSARGETRFALEIPKGLSFLAFHDCNAEVKGLEAFPPDERPHPLLVHIAFQIMVGCGTALAGLALLCAFLAWRKRGLPQQRWLLWLLVAAAPLGMAAVEAGWVVTECGRQPWVVYRVLRTAECVTPVPAQALPLGALLLLYAFLGVVTALLLKRQLLDTQHEPLGAAAPAYGSEGGAHGA